MKTEVIPFPAPGHPSRSGASLWVRMRTEISLLIGRLARHVGVPGAITNIDIHDSVSGYHLVVRIGVFYTCVSVDGRDFYFYRWSGRLDGTGSGCSSPSGPLLCSEAKEVGDHE